MTSITDSQPQVIDLLPQEFDQLSNPPRLIDVRSSVEYRMFHAPDAINLSLRNSNAESFYRTGDLYYCFWFGTRLGNCLNYCYGIHYPSPIR